MATQEQMDIDAVASEIEATNGVIPSAIALIDNFVVRLNEAGSDRTKLNALKTDLTSHREALAAAVAANSTPTPQPV